MKKVYRWPSVRAASGSSNFVDVIVAVSPTASIRDIERAPGGKVVKRWSFINAAQIRLPENKLRDLAASTGIKFVSPDSHVKGTAAL